MINLSREYSDFIVSLIRAKNISADSLKSLLIFILSEYNFSYLFLQRIYTLLKQTLKFTPSPPGDEGRKEKLCQNF